MRTYYVSNDGKVSSRKVSGANKVRTVDRTSARSVNDTLRTFERQYCNSTLGSAFLQAFGTEKLYTVKLSAEHSKARGSR